MPDMYNPGSWADFNSRKAEDARTGIMGQKEIIPNMIRWLIGQGVPEEQAVASVQQAIQPQEPELNPLEKLVAFIKGEAVPSKSQPGMSIGQHMPGVDRVQDMLTAKMQAMLEQNPLATAPPRPEWVDAKLQELQSPPEQTVREAAGFPGDIPKAVPTVPQPLPSDSRPASPSTIPSHGEFDQVGYEEGQPQRDQDRFMSQFDPDTLMKIRAQAYLKGQKGRLDAPTTILEEYRTMLDGKSPGGGGLTYGGGGPEYEARLAERQAFIDSQPMRDMEFQLENKVRRGKAEPAAAGEVVRRAAADKTEQKKIDSINKLYQSGTGASGKIDPDVAAQIEMLSGGEVKVPKYMMGVSKPMVSDAIQELAGEIANARAKLESDIMLSNDALGGAKRKDILRRKSALLPKYNLKNKMKASDPQQLWDELMEEWSKLDMEYAAHEKEDVEYTDSTGAYAQQADGKIYDNKGYELKR